MSKPKAPTPPDPMKTAEAQTGTNLATAIANTTMGQVNQVTPDGSLTYTQTGSNTFTGPDGKQYSTPQYTATTSLSPEAQKIRDANNDASLNLANLAASQSSRAGELLSRPMDTSGAPAMADRSGMTPAQYSANPNAPTYQRQSGDAGLVDTYQNDYTADRNKVEEALYSRINPQLEMQRENIQREAAARGVKPGSAAYDRLMQEYGQTANDARFGAILNAGAEQERLQNQARAAAEFTNNARQTTYGNNANQIAYNNNLSSQELSDQMLLRGREDANANTEFGQRMSLADALDRQRSQYMTEQTNLRNQPINEITALMSGSQVATPQFAIAQPSQMATTDIAGLTQQGYANQYANYQAKLAQQQATMGGLFDLGSTLIGPGGWLGKGVTKTA